LRNGNRSITASTAAACAATTNAAQSITEAAAKRPRCISVNNAGRGNYAESRTGKILVSGWNKGIAARLMGLVRWGDEKPATTKISFINSSLTGHLHRELI
jgi:ABC-type branched-subunit amino acid transport system substrate-binding protein